MSLILNVTSSNNQALQQEMKFEFNEKGGTIGRRLSNSWVLPDENRHLSGTHATVEYVNGSYFIIDTSTNGVFVNGDSKSLGNGERQELEDGFQLMMGTYSIHVGIADEPVDNETLEERSDDLFADLDDDEGNSNSGFSEKEFLEPNNDRPPSKEENNSPPIDISSDDPFFEFGEFSLDDDPVIKSRSKDVSDNSHEFNRHFEPAKFKQPISDTDVEKPSQDKNKIEPVLEEQSEEISGSVIPDDWNILENDPFDDFLSGIGGSVHPIDTEEKQEEPVKKIEEDDLFPLKNSLEEKDEEDPEQEKPSENVQPENNSNNETLEVDQKSSNSLLELGSSALMSAFIDGLGLDEKSFDEELTEKDLFLAGKLFRTAVQGTMEVLQSRAEIKNEMRMDMTTIQPVQNNPIKFAINIEEALTKLLIQKNRSYMGAEEAMKEAYDDIKSHQIAVISGIQASLVYVLKRFEPENLIVRLEKESPISANIPIHRQAKLWNKFEELYDTIESEAEDDFNRLFGQEFAKAYDEQVALLKKERKK